MLISFSGAQSTGKTTLLNHLMELNEGTIEFIPEVTRLVKREYDLPINEDGNDITQFMIVAEHVKNVYKKRKGAAILDRCMLDGIVYTHWLTDNGKVSLSGYDLASKFFNELRDKYDVIFYTNPDDVKLEDDGERSADVGFRNDIIELFEKYMSKLNNVVRLSGTVEERLKTIKQTLAKHNLEVNI